MKRLLNTLIFLLLIAGGSYYLYSTNQVVKTSVDAFIQTYKPGVGVDTLAMPSSNLTDNKVLKSKKKIPKVLKPDAFYTLDAYARKTPKQYEKNVSILTEYLLKPAKTDIEKARVLFTWVATHISYDDKGYNSDDYLDCTAESVLQKKRAVCEGYSNLLKALCNAAGLEAEKVIGYAKGYSYTIGDKFSETDHAWNVIKVENEWRLFDVTWASGFGTNKNGKLVSTSRFEPYWFNVHPKAFIFSHLPEQSKWQLTGSALTLDQYEALPYLDQTFFKLGFDPDKVYSAAISGNVKEFVETYPIEFPINTSALPYIKRLSRDNELTFIIESEYAEEIALIDGKDWHYFSKENNIFTLTHKPTNKQLKICVKINWFDKNFLSILKYNVTDK